MSIMYDKDFVFDHPAFLRRLDELLAALKKQDVDTERCVGMKRQARSTYKLKGSLPSCRTLSLWAELFHVDLHWLLLGEGRMFRHVTHQTGADRASDQWNEAVLLREQLLAAKDEIISLQRRLLQQKMA